MSLGLVVRSEARSIGGEKKLVEDEYSLENAKKICSLPCVV